MTAPRACTVDQNPWQRFADEAERYADMWLAKMFDPFADRTQAAEWLERWVDCQLQADCARQAAAWWDRP